MHRKKKGETASPMNNVNALGMKIKNESHCQKQNGMPAIFGESLPTPRNFFFPKRAIVRPGKKYQGKA